MNILNAHNSYQEAKIAHSTKEILTLNKPGAPFHGKFIPVLNGSDVSQTSEWEVCKPADYCQNWTEFKKEGVLLSVGDWVIGNDNGKAFQLDDDCLSDWNSDDEGSCDDSIFILKCKALDIANDAMAQDNEAAALEKFTKEDRYLVIKRKDIRKYLDNDETNALYRLADTVAGGREAAGKIPLECVVVESDWTIYPKVWEMIEGKSMDKQPVRTKTEYVKVEYSQAWEVVKIREEGAELFKDESGTLHISRLNSIALRAQSGYPFYRKVEKPATWQDITCDFFNEYPTVLDTVESIKAAINQVCITDKDKPTVLQREFIKMCHTVASMTDKPE